MENIRIQCKVTPTYSKNPPNLKIYIGDQSVFNGPVLSPMDINYKFQTELDTTHELRFKLYDKIAEDTLIDSDGNILEDTLVTIDDIKFEGVKLEHGFTSNLKNCYYEHDSNSHGELVRHLCLGTLGCNGDMVITFTSPIYIWLLENY